MRYKGIPRTLSTHIKKIVTVFAFLTLLLQGVQPALASTNHAITLTVTNTDDSGAGSLRQAVLDAASGDTIVFDAALAGGTIVLASHINIEKDLTIDGSSLSPHIKISGDNQYWVFRVPNFTTYVITLKGMDIENGNGSAIYQRGAGNHLTIEDIVFSNNVTTNDSTNSSGWTQGGAIYNDGYLTITNSTFTDNDAVDGGGAIYNNGIMYISNSQFTDNGASSITNRYFMEVLESSFVNNQGSGWSVVQSVGVGDYTIHSSIQSSTFSGNGGTGGGGILNMGESSTENPQYLTIVNTTITGQPGPGIYNESGNLVINSSTITNNSGYGIESYDSTGTIRTSIELINTILADNTGADCYITNTTMPINVGNLIETNAASPNACDTPAVAADPMLGPLQDNGGPTLTRALLDGSPAMDAGNNSYCPDVDQRGFPRPLDGDEDFDWACDIGAVEHTPYLIVISVNPADANPTHALFVDFTVKFSADVTNVDISDFELCVCNLTGASITNVSGSGDTYTVTVNTGNGDGTIYLDVIDDDTIQDGSGNLLGGPGIGSGSFFGGQPYAVEKTLVYQSSGSSDGWIRETSETSGMGGTLNSTAKTFNLGDAVANKQYRSILEFNTSSLPDNAVITKATLEIKRQGMSGTNPFNILGALQVDMRKPAFGASTLQLTDFKAATSKKNVASFDPTPTDGWYSALLNGAGRNYLNRTGTTQFRLYFTMDDNNDNGNDFMRFFSGNAGAAKRPQLIIEYYVP
jgi:hypothetical protein